MMVTALLAALGESAAVGGALGLVSLLDTTVGVAERIKQIRDEGKDARELLWNTFFDVAYRTFLKRVREESLLSSIRVAVQRKKITVNPAFDFSQYFHTSLSENDRLIPQYYAVLFAQLRAQLREMQVFRSNDSAEEGIFNGIAEEAARRWAESFSKARVQFPQLRQYIQDLAAAHLDQHIDGAQFPREYKGADQHLLQRKVQREYWAQNIKFSDVSKSEEAPADGKTERTNEIPARPSNSGDSAVQDAWWGDLAVRLSEAPIFLTGPGGMGKSAFLTYLYENIDHAKPECPFEGVFLLSLDALMAREKNAPDLDGEPFRDPDKSVLLRCISARSGNGRLCRGWKNVLSGTWSFIGDRPILLLLDGLNEMRARKMCRENLYGQIMHEIEALSDRKNYPNVRLIITSRVDVDSELAAQREELPKCFQSAVLGGINETCEVCGTLDPGMRELLRRPMYYMCLSNCIKDGRIPSTQYEVLRKMYCALSQQSVANAGDLEQGEDHRYIMDFLLPIIAYHDHAGTGLTFNTIKQSCVETTWWLPMIQQEMGHSAGSRIRFFGRNADQIADYLSKQEQLLLYADGQYSFSHQDYRDYLVAEYFLQRLDFMKKAPGSPLLGRRKSLNSLRLNTYGRDIMQLIYQAVSFSKKPEAGQETAFVHRFNRKKPLRPADICPGLILWYTTAYQLSDMAELVKVTYGGANLNADTLRVLEPLADYARKEPRRRADLQRLTELQGLSKQHLIEILMKACELYRRKGDYETARKITQAAHFINDPKKRDSKNWMSSVIDYNEAMVELCDFAENDCTEFPADALNKLRRCTEGESPYRFSCTRLAMILVSPQPKLAAQSEYQDFVHGLVGESSPAVFAFWLYYSALFDRRKEGEDWLFRIYALRQLLYLLAENKVQVIDQSEEYLSAVDVDVLDELGRDWVIASPACTPIPTRANLQLIRRFLEPIKGIENNWKHYMEGLACYILDNNIEKARKEFSKAGAKDVRAQLWLAFLADQKDRLTQIHEEMRPAPNTSSTEIGRYHVETYYPRDITTLYTALYETDTVSIES